MGVIYILTNPSFPKYVKIGYSDNIEKRLEELNRSECIPFAFRLYAKYYVNNRLSDKKVHELIDGLNPNLRSIENYNGKSRKREFYAMTKEQAYNILKSIAEINNLEKNLVLIEPSIDEQEDELEADEIDKTPIDFESFYINKSERLIKLHKKMFDEFQKIHKEVYEEVTPNYIALRNEKGKNICEVHLYKTKICLVTREPLKENLRIGIKLPDSYLWALNYKIYFDQENEIEKVVKALDDVYNQIKK